MRLVRLVQALLIVVLVGAAGAQEITGDIRGIVTDASGAVVSGADVQIVNVDRDTVIRDLKTGADGSYVAAYLPVGKYRVTVTASGFATHNATDIVLNVNDRRTVDVKLKVGAASGDAATGCLQHECVGPVLRGSFGAIGALCPNLAINGNRPPQNNWTIDGSDNVDRGANLTLLAFPSIDSIAEFKVLRSNYLPEHGRSSSGEVTLITRGGTDQFHGSAYEFWRNDVLNGNNYFNNRAGIARPELRWNDFGFTIGGPIFKKKTFFFYSQEWRRIITYTTFKSSEIPTALEQAGNFSETGPVCTTFDPATNSCTATGTQIASINPVAQGYINDIYSRFTPNNPDNTLTWVGRNVFNYREENVRIDHNFSSRFSIFGRYLDDSIPTQEPGGLFTGYAYSYGAVISDPTGLALSQNSPDINPTLPFTGAPRIPDVSFLDGQGITGFGPYRDYNRNHNAFANLTKVTGNHSLKFGASFNYYTKEENVNGWRSANGSFNMSDTDNGPADGHSNRSGRTSLPEQSLTSHRPIWTSMRWFTRSNSSSTGRMSGAFARTLP
jgi:hypothetical protein